MRQQQLFIQAAVLSVVLRGEQDNGPEQQWRRCIEARQRFDGLDEMSMSMVLVSEASSRLVVAG